MDTNSWPSGWIYDRGGGEKIRIFFGTFVHYDAKNNSSIWREYMRIRIKMDVRIPIKRKKKIVRKDKSEVIVTCKYEKLGDFCFICGMLSHTERFCRKKLEGSEGEISKEWGQWLRAPPRKMTGGNRSKWLREEGDGEWGRKDGKDNYEAENPGFQNTELARPATTCIIEGIMHTNRDLLVHMGIIYTVRREIQKGTSIMGWTLRSYMGLIYKKEKDKELKPSSLIYRQKLQTRTLLFLMGLCGDLFNIIG